MAGGLSHRLRLRQEAGTQPWKRTASDRERGDGQDAAADGAGASGRAGRAGADAESTSCRACWSNCKRASPIRWPKS